MKYKELLIILIIFSLSCNHHKHSKNRERIFYAKYKFYDDSGDYYIKYVRSYYDFKGIDSTNEKKKFENNFRLLMNCEDSSGKYLKLWLNEINQ
jgi:hypothetical protein